MLTVQLSLIWSVWIWTQNCSLFISFSIFSLILIRVWLGYKLVFFSNWNIASTVSDLDEPTRKEKRQKGGKSGFLAPLQLSDALIKFLGTGESALPRSDVIKRMWDYIKEKNLQVSLRKWIPLYAMIVVSICLFISLVSGALSTYSIVHLFYLFIDFASFVSAIYRIKFSLVWVE